MKTYIAYFTLLGCLLASVGCKKKKSEDPQPVFPAPAWEAAGPEKYPYSMTAVVQLPAPFLAKQDPQDELGAFIGGECRGTGIPVEIGGDMTYYVMIRGSASDGEKVSFQYFNAANGHIYISRDVVEFAIDSNYGTADQPRMLSLVSR